MAACVSQGDGDLASSRRRRRGSSDAVALTVDPDHHRAIRQLAAIEAGHVTSLDGRQLLVRSGWRLGVKPLVQVGSVVAGAPS